MKKKLLSIVFAAIMLLTMTVIVGAAEAPAAMIGDTPYPSLAEALGELKEGDILKLYSGEYDAFEILVDNVTITGVSEDTTITVVNTSNTAFIGVGGDNITIENLKFIVPESCGVVDWATYNSRSWLASVIGYADTQYNYGGVEPNGWDVKNCDFVNEGDDIAYAIFNVNEYEISGCKFDGFTTGVCSMGDNNALETVIIEGNTFTNVDYPLDVYWGIDGGAGELSVTGNAFESPKDQATVKLMITDFGATRPTNPEGTRTFEKLIVDNNTYNAPTETVIVDFSKDAVVEAGEGETVINSYTSVETAKEAVEDGEEFYLNYGSSNQTSAIIDGDDVTYTDMNPEGGVAFVDGTFYQTIQDALKNLTDNSTLTLLQNITITEKWDCRYTGATITANNVTIDGNGKTITFACLIEDKNRDTAFRVEGTGVNIKKLTIDMSEATTNTNRIGAISSNAGDLVVDNCTFIGNEDLISTKTTRAIIFGEGSQSNSDIDITILDCIFKNWDRGVNDNENAKDVGTVSITGSTFNNADIVVSASETVTLTDNTVNDSNVSITTYTDTGLSATIEGCEFDGGDVTLGSSKLVNGIDVVMEDNYINVPVTSKSKTGELLIINNVIGKDAEFSAAGNISAHGNENPTGYDIEIGASGGVKIDYKTTGIILSILRLKMEAKLRTFTITAEATEGGMISDEGETALKKGESITYSFTADEGYELVSIIVDGEELEPAESYTFTEVDSDHAIKAVFEKLDA